MNSLLDGLLDRPRTIVTLLLFLLGAGIATYFAIPKEANPDIDVPVFYVSIVQQGISPEDSERLLVKPMETALRSLDGLKEIRAVASESHAGIILEFNADFDKDEALADVRDKVDQGKAELPADAEEPTITETNFSLVPTIIVALSGDVPERTLYQHAKRLQDAVEAIPTVLSANLSGARKEQVEIIIDRTAMESYALEPLELLNALSLNNAFVPAGFIDTGSGRFSVKVPGLLEDVEDIYSLVLKQQADGVVTVRDIAEVRRSFEDPTTFTRVNGRPAITIDVVKRLGENIIENNAAVRRVVEQATADWPEPIKVDFLLDQSNFIFEVLGNLELSVISAIFCVMIVVVASLGFRSAFLVGLSIPTTFVLSFLVLSGLGMTVNMMVMFGLVLTVGILVDGGIIMVEYAETRMALGMSRKDAFKASAKVMFMPMFSSTLTTLIAFLPMLLWPGVPGEFMSYLPIMVIIVLTVALGTALIFLPTLGAVLSTEVLIGGSAGAVAAAVPFVLLPDGGTLTYGAAAFAFVLAAAISARLARTWDTRRPRPVPPADETFRVDEVRGINGVYVRTLRFLAGSVAGILVTVVVVVGVSAASLAYFMGHNAGVEFFVDEEPDVAIVLVSGRGNMSAREALALVGEVEREVLAIDGVDNVRTTAFPSGGSSGGGGVDDVSDKPADIVGELQIELVDYAARRKATAIFDEIRSRTDFPGIKVEVRKIEGGPPQGKDIQLQVTSTSYDTLLDVVGRVRDHVATVEGLRDVEDDRPLPGIEWQLDVDRVEAGRFGADVTTIGQIVQLVTNGVLLTKVTPDDSDDQIDVRVRFPERERTLDQFENLRLTTSAGTVPMINFIDITPQQRVSSITRLDGLYAMTVKADVLGELGYDLNAKIAELDGWVQAQEWPAGTFFAFRGSNEEQAESAAFLMQAMIASLVMMFLVLVTQFNSIYQTVLTLFTILLSVFGVLLGMAITGQKFSVIMTGTGVLALAGIVVGNAIVLIDTFNREKTIQKDVLTAVLSTAAQRIRPVLLTTITTVTGLIPMATQVNLDILARTTRIGGITDIWWVQMSTAIISGLTFSTILTLVMVPVFLAAPATIARTFAQRRGRGDAAPVLADAAAPAFALAGNAAVVTVPLVVRAPQPVAISMTAPLRGDGRSAGDARDAGARRSPPVAATGPGTSSRPAGEIDYGSAVAASSPPTDDLDVYAPVLARPKRPPAADDTAAARPLASHPEAAE